MWQRIQTVFLGIAILALLVSLVFPIWSLETGEINVLTAFYYLKGDRYQYSPYSLTAILVIGSATLAFIEIFKYKNRLTQMKIGALNSLFLVAAVGSADVPWQRVVSRDGTISTRIPRSCASLM